MRRWARPFAPSLEVVLYMHLDDGSCIGGQKEVGGSWACGRDKLGLVGHVRRGAARGRRRALAS